MARHFSLMRRVAEAPVPAGNPNPPLAFNVSAVLQLIPKGTTILNRIVTCCRPGIKAASFDVVLKMKHVPGITLLN